MPQALNLGVPITSAQLRLKSPAELFGTGTQHRKQTTLRPSQATTGQFSQVSDWLNSSTSSNSALQRTALKSPDQLFLKSTQGRPSAPVLQGMFSLPMQTGLHTQRNQIQAVLVQSAEHEWRSGVRETQGRNRSPRIDTYARNAKFGPGYEWCGFFTAFNYSQAGFKYPESFASYQKARDFFLYRSYTSRSVDTHQRLDQLRIAHESSGDTRKYMMMEGSAGADYVNNYKRYYAHIDLAQMTYSWQSIPIQAGDVALFSHGHVGQVLSYNPTTGHLVTIEGNTSGQGPDGKRWSQAVVKKTYDLSKSEIRAKFDGFGRPALADFNP